MLARPTTLVWAIGSLDGYATRAELLCAAVDIATERVSPVTVERAQELLLAMSVRPVTSKRRRVPCQAYPYPTLYTHHDGLSSDGFDVEAIKTRAEQFMLSEFGDVATAFGKRDRLLTEKAERLRKRKAQFAPTPGASSAGTSVSSRRTI